MESKGTADRLVELIIKLSKQSLSHLIKGLPYMYHNLNPSIPGIKFSFCVSIHFLQK